MGPMFIGWRLLAAGVRRRSPPLAFVGAALVAIAFVRRTQAPKREMVYSESLRGKNRLMVGLRRPGERAGQRRR